MEHKENTVKNKNIISRYSSTRFTSHDCPLVVYRRTACSFTKQQRKVPFNSVTHKLESEVIQKFGYNLQIYFCCQ